MGCGRYLFPSGGGTVTLNITHLSQCILFMFEDEFNGKKIGKKRTISHDITYYKRVRPSNGNENIFHDSERYVLCRIYGIDITGKESILFNTLLITHVSRFILFTNFWLYVRGWI